MAQHDYDIANQDGAAFRADLNAALAAIVSQNSGATEPAQTFPYMFWADTAAGILKRRNAENDAWISVMSLIGGLIIGTDIQAYSANIATVLASKAEMESGTEAAVRSMSPLRVSQAISALAGGNQIQPISASVASNALTISASALRLDFRSTTLGSGTVTKVTGTPSDLVISSGSTLGTMNAQASRIAVLALNNAGTIELAAVNLDGGVNLDETGLISTTAEGGAGAADSAAVVYSTTARTNVAYRVIGYVESTQATAGKWATAPSTIQGAGGNAVTSMRSFGYGQTLQSVTRTIGTTYYNTTGKPICVYANGSTGSANNSYWLAQINGVSVMQSNPSPGSNSWISVGFVVPPGCSYSIIQGVGTTPIAFTYEMR